MIGGPLGAVYPASYFPILNAPIVIDLGLGPLGAAPIGAQRVSFVGGSTVTLDGALDVRIP